jgi:hypothetical protein
MNNVAPPTSTNFTSEGHFSTKTFRMGLSTLQESTKGRFSSWSLLLYQVREGQSGRVLIVNPHVLRCFLRPSLTEAPSLHRSYPASSVVRTSPPPHTTRPARSPSRHATLSIESSDSFVASAAASIATGWSEPVPGRDLHPLKSSAFHGALYRQLPDWSLL